MTSIAFDKEVGVGPHTKNLIMWAYDGGKRIRCQITALVFEDYFEGVRKDRRGIYEEFVNHRARFEMAFRRMIDA
ncbi:DUF1488 family protein, partial [Azospirillum sp. A23]|uniref:DUF1488 family protein n=1 Tax=Azospirillum sp. A23 TaxID=3160608 RepID=UPI0036F19B22